MNGLLLQFHCKRIPDTIWRSFNLSFIEASVKQHMFTQMLLKNIISLVCWPALNQVVGRQSSYSLNPWKLSSKSSAVVRSDFFLEPVGSTTFLQNPSAISPAFITDRRGNHSFWNANERKAAKAHLSDQM